ncbi:MAG: hypothetical protein ACRC6X_03540 [Culicoidibacterales bacterium]
MQKLLALKYDLLVSSLHIKTVGNKIVALLAVFLLFSLPKMIQLIFLNTVNNTIVGVVLPMFITYFILSKLIVKNVKQGNINQITLYFPIIKKRSLEFYNTYMGLILLFAGEIYIITLPLNYIYLGLLTASIVLLAIVIQATLTLIIGEKMGTIFVGALSSCLFFSEIIVRRFFAFSILTYEFKFNPAPNDFFIVFICLFCLTLCICYLLKKRQNKDKIVKNASFHLKLKYIKNKDLLILLRSNKIVEYSLFLLISISGIIINRLNQGDELLEYGLLYLANYIYIYLLLSGLENSTYDIFYYRRNFAAFRKEKVKLSIISGLLLFLVTVVISLFSSENPLAVVILYIIATTSFLLSVYCITPNLRLKMNNKQIYPWKQKMGIIGIALFVFLIFFSILVFGIGYTTL